MLEGWIILKSFLPVWNRSHDSYWSREFLFCVKSQSVGSEQQLFKSVVSYGLTLWKRFYRYVSCTTSPGPHSPRRLLAKQSLQIIPSYHCFISHPSAPSTRMGIRVSIAGEQLCEAAKSHTPVKHYHQKGAPSPTQQTNVAYCLAVYNRSQFITSVGNTIHSCPLGCPPVLATMLWKLFIDLWTFKMIYEHKFIYKLFVNLGI